MAEYRVRWGEGQVTDLRNVDVVELDYNTKALSFSDEEDELIAIFAPGQWTSAVRK